MRKVVKNNKNNIILVDYVAPLSEKEQKYRTERVEKIYKHYGIKKD